VPSDEELQRLTGMNVLTEGAAIDKELLDAWMTVGFSREEAMQLLLTMKPVWSEQTLNVRIIEAHE
jgi:23S rRNA C2498 (ribose-2'-O)-methylase RlmM